MKGIQRSAQSIGPRHLLLGVLILAPLCLRVQGAEVEGVQIGNVAPDLSTKERHRIWPPTEELVNQPLDEFISKHPSSWSGHSLHDYFALCKEVLNRPCSFEATDAEDVWNSTDVPKIHLTKTTPAKVLDEILKPYPDYRWVIRNDVVNVEPIRPHKKDVLSRKLDHVRFDGKSSFEASLDTLKQAKIRWAWQSVNGTQHGTFARISLELKNVSVREALNAIVREDGQIMWEYFPPKRSWKIERDGTLFMPSYRKNGVTEHLEK